MMTVSDDYEPITYLWLYVQIGNENSSIAKCIVDSLTYKKYNTGDTIGIVFTSNKHNRNKNTIPKSMVKQQHKHLITHMKIIMIYLMFIICILFLVYILIIEGV